MAIWRARAVATRAPTRADEFSGPRSGASPAVRGAGRRPTGRSGREGARRRAPVAFGKSGRAAAAVRRIAVPPAGAGVHRRDELEPRREVDGPPDAGDADAPLLQRLAQRLERRRGRTRAARRGRAPRRCASVTSPGDRRGPPPTMRRVRRGVVRRSERRAAGRSPSTGPVPATDATTVASSASASSSGGRRPGIVRASSVLPEPGGPMSSRSWPPARATSSARRASSWPRTSARSGAPPSAPALLAPPARASTTSSGQLDSGAVGPAPLRPRRATQERRRPRPASRPPTTSMPRDEPRLRDRVRGHDDPPSPAAGERRDHRQQRRARGGPRRRAKLTEKRPAPRGPHLLGADEDADRDGQVERGAGLAQVRRGEVDGDAARRIVEAAVADGAAHPLARLRQGSVRQADDREARQPGRDVDLDPDESPVEAVERGGTGALRARRRTVGRRRSPAAYLPLARGSLTRRDAATLPAPATPGVSAPQRARCRRRGGRLVDGPGEVEERAPERRVRLA